MILYHITNKVCISGLSVSIILCIIIIYLSLIYNLFAYYIHFLANIADALLKDQEVIFNYILKINMFELLQNQFNWI